MLGVSEGWHYVVGQPFTQASVFGAVVVDEQGVDAGFADQQGVFEDAVNDDSRGLMLIGIEFSDGAFVEEKAKQTAQVSGAEPRLVFDQKRVEVEFVAGEDVRD
jgi:hypothetical protein